MLFILLWKVPLNSQVSVWSPKSCLKVIRIWFCPAFGCLLTKVYDQLHKSYWLGPSYVSVTLRYGSDILTFESVSEIEKCDYSNQPTKQYFSVVLFITLHEIILTFETVGKKTKTQQEKKKHKWTISKVAGLAAHAILAEESTTCVASASFALSLKTNQTN